MADGEHWLPVLDYEGLYEGEAEGAIRSLPRNTTRGRVLKQSPGSNGYLTVVLCKDGKPKTRPVHQLIAEAFHGPRPPGQEVRHLDGVRNHNAESNLAWGDKVTNMQDAIRHGTNAAVAKMTCAQGHPLSGDNVYWSRNGKRRTCKTCHNDYGAEYARTNRDKINARRRRWRARKKAERTAQ